MTWREGWRRLSPRAQRGLMLGVGLVALGLVVYLFVRTDAPPARRGRDEVIKQILTDKDPRSLGFDAVNAELKVLREQLEVTQRQLQQGQREPPAALRDELQRLQETLRNELREFREEIRREPPPTAPPTPPTAPPTPPTAPHPPAPVQPTTPALTAPVRSPAAGKPAPSRPDTLFAPPAGATSGALAPPVAPAGLPGLPGLPPAPAPSPKSAPQIRVLTESAAAAEAGAKDRPAGTAPAGPGRTGAAPSQSGRADGIYLPTSILSGTLLTGLDAPTGQGARADPIPALLRVKHEALGPNFATVDIRECFLIAAGHGDLSSERAYLRAETLSCVRRDGGVIEAPVEAYAVGEDGKAGIGGRLVSKQGQVLARALQAGFLEAFAKVFQKQPVATIDTSAASKTPYQSNLSSAALGSASLAGVGNALDRLAQFYIDLAQGMFPVIEISAGRPIDFIVIRGQELQLQTRRGP